MRCPTCHGYGYIERPVLSSLSSMAFDPKSVYANTTISISKETCKDCGGTGNTPPKWWTVSPATQTQMQHHFNQQYQNLINNISGVTPQMRRRPSSPKKPKIDGELLVDQQLRKILANQLDAACFGDTLGSSIERLPEFIEGVIEEEERWRREVNWMGGRWRGNGSPDDKIAKVWLDEQRGVLCARFPYDVKVVDDFKLKIPKGKKAWDGEKKIWEFSVEVIDLLVGILEEHFPGKVVDLTQAISTPRISQGGDNLLELLDEEDIKQIRRVLSLRHHPDKGGDSKKMAKINEVLDRRLK